MTDAAKHSERRDVGPIYSENFGVTVALYLFLKEHTIYTVIYEREHKLFIEIVLFVFFAFLEFLTAKTIKLHVLNSCVFF